jgi:hypothetical protein
VHDDVTPEAVDILATTSKAPAAAWLAASGEPSPLAKVKDDFSRHRFLHSGQGVVALGDARVPW